MRIRGSEVLKQYMHGQVHVDLKLIDYLLILLSLSLITISLITSCLFYF
jgi:hypothetical protein